MPVQIAPPALTVAHRANDAGYEPSVRLQQTPQPQVQIPQIDIAIEVFGNAPLQAKLEDVTRRLGRRQVAGSINRAYPTTILELIRLVERNPEKPRRKAWDSIGALSLRFDPDTQLVSVEYCVEHCGHDPRTGAFDPKRRMVTYRAPEAKVITKANKKLDDLKKYADR